MFNRPVTSFGGSGGGRSSGGGSQRREQTKDELLAQLSQQREERALLRARNAAATTIAAAFRGRRERQGRERALLSEWRSRFAGAAADPSGTLPTAAELFDGAVPLLLAVLLPPGAPSTKAQLESGEPLPASSCAGAAGAAARGTMALLMRSLAATDAARNYACLGFTPPAGSADGWELQAARLCQLCALLSAPNGGGGHDGVLPVAAARCVSLLTNEREWKGAAAAAGEPCAAAAAARVRLRLAHRPAPLMRAARRALDASNGSSDSASGGAATTLAAITASPARLVGAALSMLESAPCEAGAGAAAPAAPSACCRAFAATLLPAPSLAAAVGGDAARARLQQPCVLLPLFAATQRLAAELALRGGDALHALGNVVDLVLPSAAAPAAADGDKSDALDDAAVTGAYCAAVGALLAAAAAGDAGGIARGSGNSLPPLPLRRIGDARHLERLLRALRPARGGVACWAAFCARQLEDVPKITAARSAAAAAAAGDSDTANNGGGAAATASPALNALAFSPALLPALWRELAVALGLPLEAPLEATRGLDVGALAGGADALADGDALALGVFCRAYAQLLLVLDDADVHERGAPFSPAATRAIAASLNSLVFFTAAPAPLAQQRLRAAASGGGGGGGGGGSVERRLVDAAAAACPAVDARTLADGRAMLRRFSAVALRALYERDARRAFCQPQLWLAPWNAAHATAADGGGGGGGALSSAAAIVQALLLQGGGGDDASTGGARAASSAGASSSGGSALARPGAVAALLRAAPQAVPFDVRLELFRGMLREDRARGRWGAPRTEGGTPPIKLTVRRDRLLDDAFAALAGCGGALRTRLDVAFIGAHGAAEAGLDHGGLTKELLEGAISAALNPSYGLFAEAPSSGLAYPSALAERLPHGLALLKLTGALLGKALYEGLLMPLQLAPFVWHTVAARRPLGLDDLAGLDPELHRSLLAVKNYGAGGGGNDVADLGLTFTAEADVFGRTVRAELLGTGRGDEPVTRDNVLLYVHLLADFHLNRRLGAAVGAFARGLGSVTPLPWLRMFSPAECNELVGGSAGGGGGVDVDDMQKHCRYANGYTAASPTVRFFFKVVAGFSAEQRAALLRFVTSCSRAPLGGFAFLEPPLTLARVPCPAPPLALLAGKDVERLPTAATCFNTLKLPNYRRQATLRAKLLAAITAGAGFDLS